MPRHRVPFMHLRKLDHSETALQSNYYNPSLQVHVISPLHADRLGAVVCPFDFGENEPSFVHRSGTA